MVGERSFRSFGLELSLLFVCGTHTNVSEEGEEEREKANHIDRRILELLLVFYRLLGELGLSLSGASGW